MMQHLIRSLALVPQQPLHAPCSILVRTFSTVPTEFGTINHTMKLIACSLRIAISSLRKVEYEGWPGHVALLEREIDFHCVNSARLAFGIVFMS